MSIFSALFLVGYLWTLIYHQPSRLFIDGEHIWSQEGTTQGDPLAMVMYAIGMLPLIHRLYRDPLHRSGMLMMHLLEAVSLACIGGGMCYSQVVHCLDIILTPARLVWLWSLNIFETQKRSSRLRVCKTANHYTGAAASLCTIGFEVIRWGICSCQSECESFRDQISVWDCQQSPQAAYAALTHGIMSRWTHLMHTVPGIGNLF